jgi:hypothetical protein
LQYPHNIQYITQLNPTYNLVKYNFISIGVGLWVGLLLLDVEKESQRLFRYAIHVIYGAVIAVSFDIAKDVVVPITAIPSHILNTLLLGLSYLIIVTSWIGYHVSIINSPHEGKIGRIRFCLDIFIIFIFYYMVSLTHPDKSLYIPDVFLYVLPFLYFTYLVWDTLKIHEYKEKSSHEKHLDRLDARNITLYYFITFMILWGGYIFALYITNYDINSQTSTIRDSIFIIIASVQTLRYRLAKWTHLTKSKYERI